MGRQEELAAMLKAPAAVVFSWEPTTVVCLWKAAGTPSSSCRWEPPEGGGKGNAGGATALGVAATGPRRDEEPVVEGHAAGG